MRFYKFLDKRYFTGNIARIGAKHQNKLRLILTDFEAAV